MTSTRLRQVQEVPERQIDQEIEDDSWRSPLRVKELSIGQIDNPVKMSKGSKSKIWFSRRDI